MNFTLKVWRQKNRNIKGKLETYGAEEISSDISFLEMLDQVNENLAARGIEPIAFDHDCREGICGSCSLTLNGIPHGHERGTTVCQLHMRHFKDGETITIEPWRAKPFPVVKDLVVDRNAFERIIQAGGYISVSTGGAPDGNAIPIAKEKADRAMDAAQCIGCGACAAACPNASAMLFVASKVSHLALLPQGKVERAHRVKKMIKQMDSEQFGNCTNHFECEAACPKKISVSFIAHMNREYLNAHLQP